MKKSLFLMACIGICALALVACGKEKQFSAGEEMNADEARALREKLLIEQGAETPKTEVEQPAEDKNVGLPEVCYYTEKGGKWHVSADCRYLKNSTDILEGSVESAAYAGKSQPCSVCAAMYIGE